MPEPPAVANSNADGELLVLVGRETELHGDVTPLIEWLAEHGWNIDLAVPPSAQVDCMRPSITVVELPWTQAMRSAAARKTLRDLLCACVKSGSYDAILCADPVSGLLGRWSLPRRTRGNARMIAVSSPLNAITRSKGMRKLLLSGGERILSSRTDAMIVHSADELRAAKRLVRLTRCKPVLLPCLGVKAKRPPTIERSTSLRALFETRPEQLMVFVPHTFDDARTERLILDYAASLRELEIDVRVVVVGGGPNESRMRQSVRDERLSGVIAFSGDRPGDGDLALSCDLALALGAKPRTRARIAECLLAGVPVIALPLDRLRTLVTEAHAVADSFDSDALARLTSTYADEGARATLAQTQRSRAQQTLAVEILGPRVARILKGMLDE